MEWNGGGVGMAGCQCVGKVEKSSNKAPGFGDGEWMSTFNVLL